jgi:hypothetical protein
MAQRVKSREQGAVGKAKKWKMPAGLQANKVL